MTYYGEMKSLNVGATFTANVIEVQNTDKVTDSFSVIVADWFNNLFVAKRSDNVNFKGFLIDETGYFMMGNDNAQ